MEVAILHHTSITILSPSLDRKGYCLDQQLFNVIELAIVSKFAARTVYGPKNAFTICTDRTDRQTIEAPL